MNNFGVFGIMPISGGRHDFYPAATTTTNKIQKKHELPFTPAVFKEKMITSFLLIASLPVVYMISML